MTSRIHQLDPATIRRIAAGEVIERPASVLKELIDNALDAGSTRIDIVLHNGGRQLIQVTDNGCGMTAEEATLALQRFTTSKIQHIDDLQTLTTLGFRGEALPSIAAVADVEILTRMADDSEGVLVQCHPSGATEARPIGCPVGTQVRVQALFRHVPVRLHSLKTVAREVQLMQELVTHYALACHKVMFHVKHDERRIFFSQSGSALLPHLVAILGPELGAQMLPISWQNVDLVIHGAVSSATTTRASHQRQYLWVNGRPVRSPLIGAALERAYGAQLPPGRHPVAALGVRMAPALLDVNIHPRKAEVRFLQERAVFAGVQEAVALALQRATPVPTPMREEEADGEVWPSRSLTTFQVHESTADYAQAGLSSAEAGLQALGQLGNTFLLVKSPQGLLVLDQHVAHESLLHAVLLSPTCQSQELETPWSLTLSPPQAQACGALQDVFATLGLQLEPFGPGMVLVRAVPRELHALLHPGNFVEAVQEAIQRTPQHASPETWREHLAAALACRTAVRAGDALSTAEIATLLTAVRQQGLAYTCPHGRPTAVTLTLAELERRFLR